MTDRPIRNDFATVALTLAAAALISRFFSAAVLCIGLGAAAMVMAAMGVRQAVRTDNGMPRALFGLAFGLLAAFLGTILLGGQHGGTFSGLPHFPVRSIPASATYLVV